MGINIKAISSVVSKIETKVPLEVSSSAATNIGKHLIPKNLYHLTTKNNYQSMLKEGVLDVGGDKDFIQGVFMFDLVNFFKCWAPSKEKGLKDMRKTLIKYVSNFGDELVLLKIPTKELEKENLLLRSLERANKLEKKNEFAEVKKAWSRTGKSPNNEFKHLLEGDIAKNSKLYKQRKEAIEFIYPDEIDMSKVEKVGTIKPYQDLLNTELDSGQNFLLKAFTDALAGKREEKAITVLKNNI